MIAFLPPLAYADNYPPPFCRMRPAVDQAQGQFQRPLPARAQARLYTYSGRTALALIALWLQQRHRGAGSARVLLPDYHCPAMVEPFVWAGCDIAFYPLLANLHPDPQPLERLAATADALLAVRFFGVDCGIQEAAAIGRRNHCLVIEDLAHAAHAPAVEGDLAVTSLKKFYPLEAGGELLITDPALVEPLVTIQKQRLRPPLTRLLGKLYHRLADRSPHDSAYRYFCPDELARPIPAGDRRRLTEGDHRRFIRIRRHHYAQLAQRLADSALGHPLYPTLNEGEVPYVFPFLLNDAAGFEQLRHAGVPLYRWEELAEPLSAIGHHYRAHLVQLPCHQGLTSEDLATICRVVTSTRGATGAGS